MYSIDIARKPFFVRTGRDVGDVRTYGRTDKGDAICPPPHYKWRGHKNTVMHPSLGASAPVGLRAAGL